MKRYAILPLFLCLMTTACTQLSAEDRATVNSAQSAAEEARLAREAATRAEANARAAQEAAEEAADKSDRIFRQSQNK